MAAATVSTGPDLRGVMRHFATGVCVVTTYVDRDGQRQHDAVTVNSLSSLSLDPPLVCLSLRPDSAFLEDLLRSEVWGVSILDSQGEFLARSFARRRTERGEDAAHPEARVGPRTGVLLFEAAGWLECAYRTHFTAGDHVVVIGAVLDQGHDEDRDPLIFVRGGFHSLTGACHDR